MTVFFSVDCRWSLWTECDPCKGGDQKRKVVRNRTCDETGVCGRECSEKESTSKPCTTVKCEIQNSEGKLCTIFFSMMTLEKVI